MYECQPARGGAPIIRGRGNINYYIRLMQGAHCTAKHMNSKNECQRCGGSCGASLVSFLWKITKRDCALPQCGGGGGGGKIRAPNVCNDVACIERRNLRHLNDAWHSMAVLCGRKMRWRWLMLSIEQVKMNGCRWTCRTLAYLTWLIRNGKLNGSNGAA